mmetsp:Transcript_511/g.937  ORF Transcript_511/g.937 Transcript_511/m.937 type:complete len:404 (+) Transcript_511:329-1540(+)
MFFRGVCNGLRNGLRNKLPLSGRLFLWFFTGLLYGLFRGLPPRGLPRGLLPRGLLRGLPSGFLPRGHLVSLLRGLLLGLLRSLLLGLLLGQVVLLESRPFVRRWMLPVRRWVRVRSAAGNSGAMVTGQCLVAPMEAPSHDLSQLRHVCPVPGVGETSEATRAYVIYATFLGLAVVPPAIGRSVAHYDLSILAHIRALAVEFPFPDIHTIRDVPTADQQVAGARWTVRRCQCGLTRGESGGIRGLSLVGLQRAGRLSARRLQRRVRAWERRGLVRGFQGVEGRGIRGGLCGGPARRRGALGLECRVVVGPVEDVPLGGAPVVVVREPAAVVLKVARLDDDAVIGGAPVPPRVGLAVAHHELAVHARVLREAVVHAGGPVAAADVAVAASPDLFPSVEVHGGRAR